MSNNSQSKTQRPNQSPDQASDQENQGFEAALSELEAIVSQMESGQLPLEQSLAAYRRGTTLLQSCQKALADIEQQIQILNEAGKLQPYSDQDA